MKILHTLFVFVLICQISFAQQYMRASDLDKKWSEEYKEAQKLIRQGKYGEAEKKIDRILKKFPSFHEAALRKAVMYYDTDRPLLAIPLFDDVIHKVPDYDAEMYYAAAVNALSAGMDEKAIGYYETYLMKGKPDEKRNSAILKELATLTFRVQAKKNPVSIQPIPLKGFINTEESEYLPSPSLDGKSMIFTRRAKGQEDLYVSYKNENGEWSVGSPLESINTPDNEAAHSTSEDGNIIVFTMCNNKTTGFGSCDLYYTQFDGEKFTLPVNMGPRINTPAWESQPCLFANGQKILFASNRKGSYGGNDLWMAQKTAEGKWGPVTNLGSVINTEAQEESPFLHSDGKTLYFRSNGHTGMGGFDLFMSKWDAKTKEWSTPVNLGYPINSTGDEGSLAIDHLGKTAYFSSDAQTSESKEPNLDIMQFDLPPALRPEAVSYLELSVVDETSDKPLDASVLMMDVDTSDTIVVTQALRGKMLSTLPPNRRLLLHVSMPGYLLHSEHINTGENFTAEQPQFKIVKMRKPLAADNRPVILKNIFFETASAVLLASSMAEIQSLASMLKSQNTIHIRIIGHTDNVGDENANLVLSRERAKAVYEELIRQGIESHRLSFEGKGEKEPVAGNDTPEGRAANRRTEFIITENKTK